MTVISDICDFVGGSQPPKAIFKSVHKEGYIRFIQTRDYKTDDFLTFIPIETARRFCNKDDIMIGRYGPPIFQILRGLEGAYNVALMKAIPKPNTLNDYLYYLLKQESIFQYVDRLSSRTGGQTGVDLVSLNQYPVLLPSLPYQQKVVAVLKALDSKINLNIQITFTLEAIAKTLYEYWFVQFDFPDEKGKPYKSEGGKMVWNEELKREIPLGWKVEELGKHCQTSRGVTYKKEDIKSLSDKNTIPILRATNISNGVIDVNDMVYIPEDLVSNDQLMKKFDVLITMSSGSKAHVGKNAFYYFDNKVSFGAFCSKLSANKNMRFYVNIHMQSDGFKKYISNVGLGTNIKNLTNKHITEYKLLIPPNEVLLKFETYVEGLYNKICNNMKESQSLMELRDWLLPMLMNGQVTVS